MKINKTKGFKLRNKKTMIALSVVCILVGAMFVSTVSAQAKFGDRIKQFITNVKKSQVTKKSTPGDGNGGGGGNGSGIWSRICDRWKANKAIRRAIFTSAVFTYLIKPRRLIGLTAFIVWQNRKNIESVLTNVSSYVKESGGLPEACYRAAGEIDNGTINGTRGGIFGNLLETYSKGKGEAQEELNGDLLAYWVITRFTQFRPRKRIATTIGCLNAGLNKFARIQLQTYGMSGVLRNIGNITWDVRNFTQG